MRGLEKLRSKRKCCTRICNSTCKNVGSTPLFWVNRLNYTCNKTDTGIVVVVQPDFKPDVVFIPTCLCPKHGGLSGGVVIFAVITVLSMITLNESTPFLFWPPSWDAQDVWSRHCRRKFEERLGVVSGIQGENDDEEEKEDEEEKDWNKSA